MPGNTLASVKFQNPFTHVIQEVAVVCNGYHGTLILLQMLLKPVDALCIKVVGRLVEQQHIRLLQEQAAECHTTPLTTREVCDRQVALRTA